MLVHKDRYFETEYRSEVYSPKGLLILDTHTISSHVPGKLVEEIQTFYPRVPMIFLTLVLSDIACKGFPCPLIYCQQGKECLQEYGILEKVFVFPRENENAVLQTVNEVLLREAKRP